MYWNVVKRTLKGDYVKIIKSIPCYGQNDFNMKLKAQRIAARRNFLRRFFNKYYYDVEFDFE